MKTIAERMEPAELQEFDESTTDVDVVAAESSNYGLNDPWSKPGWIPLDRFLERERFSPWFAGILVAFLLFILFNIIGGLVAVVLLLAGAEPGMNPNDMLGQLNEAISEQLWGNTLGQLLGLAIPVLLIARLHSSASLEYLRIRSTDLKLMALSVLGLVAIWPGVMLLVWLNDMIPVPDVFEQMDALRMEFIEKVLLENQNVWFNLFALAVTPAICEEFLFRGYLQRQMERSTSVVLALTVTGVIFGMYHLSISQVLPLSALGIFLCWITWKSGSIWPAVLVHFLNNAFSVISASILSNDPDFDVQQLDALPLPWYQILVLTILGLALLKWVATKMDQHTTTVLTTRQTTRETI